MLPEGYSGLFLYGGIRNFYQPVLQLLQDSDETVRCDASFPRPRALRIIRAASRVPQAAVGIRLEQALKEGIPPDVAAEVYASLSRRGYRAGAGMKKTINQIILLNAAAMARVILSRNEFYSLHEKAAPLQSVLQDLYLRHLDNIFLLCSYLYNPDDILGIERKVLEGTDKQRALGSELLDVLLESEIKRQVLAVVEQLNIGRSDTTEIAELFHLTHMTIPERLAEMRDGGNHWPDPWLRTCADYTAWRLELGDIEMEDTMLTVIERVLALKQADIFNQIPDAVLAHIASIAEDIDLPAGKTFIHKGEMGDCMYIICDGLVAIHDQKTRFAELTAGSVVGEMALLDPEPRSASATTLEETGVLRIDRDSFDSVMADHPGIARGVISVLCNRLRKAIDKK